MKHFSTSAGVSSLFSPSAAATRTGAGGSSDILFATDAVNHHDEEEDTSNETLQRLLNEVTLAVAEDDDDELIVKAAASDAFQAASATTALLSQPRSVANLYVNSNIDDDEHAPLPPFSVSGTTAGPPSELFPAATVGRGVVPAATTSNANGGFIVEGSTPTPTSMAPLPPPPMYGTPSMASTAATPFSCYSGIPSHANGTAPPSFAEAIASTTPLSLHGGTPADISPMTAHYVPPGPTTMPDPILLCNKNGVFLLNPILPSAKPTPPYTPPTATTTPPISPLPRYSLPPPQGQLSLPVNGFLGASVAQQQQQQQQQHGRTRSGSFNPPNAMVDGPPPPPPPPPQYGTSPFLSYTQSITSVRGTPSFGTAPPPYSA